MLFRSTIFRDTPNSNISYEIINEVGNIYIGPGLKEHKVIVNENYYSPRITLGFDVYVHNETRPNYANESFALIPI